MSLLDALLLDPWRDPRDIYIAVRTDGQRGSGTMDDPFDGGTKLGAPILADLTCNRTEFIVGTLFPHGLQPSDVGTTVISISNVRGEDNGLFNGSMLKLKAILSPIHFLMETQGTPPVVPVVPPAVESAVYPQIKVEYPNNVGNQNSLPTVARIYWPVAKVTSNEDFHHPSFGSALIEKVAGVGNDEFEGNYAALGVADSGRAFYFLLTFPPGSEVSTTCQTQERSHSCP